MEPPSYMRSVVMKLMTVYEVGVNSEMEDGISS
jgi:hypothetical protein